MMFGFLADRRRQRKIKTRLWQTAKIGLLICALFSLGDGALNCAAAQSTWLHEGIVASSDMESLTFVLRRGGAPEDVVQQWRTQRSEDAVWKLKAAGVNFAIT